MYHNNTNPNTDIHYPKVVSILPELYHSMQGNYFVGYADDLAFGNYKSAWARIYNPKGSGVLLYVNVWTVVAISNYPFRAQLWLNATAPGEAFDTPLVTPTNTAISPLPTPVCKLQQASSVTGGPTGGVMAYSRRGQPESTMVSEENGKFIIPPGGNFLIFVSNAENPDKTASGRVAYGWWEEKIGVTDTCLDIPTLSL